MKKKILSLLLAAVMVLAMAACAEEQEPTDPTRSEPTLPSFQKDKTPLEQLTDALEKTRSAASMAIEFGLIATVGEDHTEFIVNGSAMRHGDSYNALLSLGGEDQQIWFDGVDIYQRSGSEYTCYPAETFLGQKNVVSDLYAFATNANLLEDLCSTWLMVSPSNDGTFRFEVDELTTDEFSALTGIAPMDGIQTEPFTVALIVDADGYLSRLEYSTENSVAYVSMTNIGNEPELTPPDWLNQP